MGRTNPTYRHQVQRFVDDWQTFRRALRYPNQEYWDSMMEAMDRYAMEGGAQNPADPEKAMFLSVMLAQQKEIAELREALVEEGIVDGEEAALPEDQQRLG